MVNRQRRNPGELARFEATGRVSENLPSFATPGNSAVFEALAGVGARLSSQLGAMADKAAAREGELAGLSAGQLSAAAYLRQRAVQTEAEGVKPPSMAHAPGDIRKTISEAAQRHGVDPNALLQVAGIESSFNPRAKNPNSSAGGLFQFIDSTAKQYGLSDRYDPAQASDAAARLMKDNADYLRKQLGREPSAGELYLAHQQGMKGAADLLRDPNRRAADIVGAKAVTLNGGKADMTAGEFAGLWMRKVGGKVTTAAAADPAATDSDQVPTLSTTPLALRRDGTIRGDAFDASAIRAYGWRMQQGLSNDLAAAYDAHKDDPAEYTKAVAKVRDTYLADDNLSDPRLREAFDQEFAAKSEGYARDVANRQEVRLRQEEQASFAGALDAQVNELERQTMALGASQDGDAIAARQLGRVVQSIDKAVADGTISPAAAVKLRASAEETAVRGRMQGVYDALDSPEKKRQFALDVLEEWKSGKGPIAKLGYDQAKRISDTLFADATDRSEKERASNKLEAAKISDMIRDDLASTEATGKGIADIDVARAEQLLGPEKVAAWKADREVAAKTFSATAGMETQSADDLATRVAALEPKPGTVGFADQERIFAAAQKRASGILKERAADPAAAAEKSFPDVAELAANARAEDPDSMASLVTARLQAQSALGIDELGQEPLTNKEALALSRAVTIDPDPAKQAQRMEALADQVASAYGPHADKVMAQILRARGIDRDMATMGAAFFRRAEAKIPTADRRAADTSTDISAADKAGKAVATDQFALPNYQQQQLLMNRPELAADFDRKFGPGAAQRILGRRRTPSQSFTVDGGTVTVNPDGSEDFTPLQTEKK